MIDRHRSLIHMLMAGLVGLTLGLFIGWWVWPVQWIEAPGTAPAASAPAQSVEQPAAGNEESDSNYSALLDWVNQGLLYVAAALLLVGGVVIGYQLLRQSQGKDSTEQPFPLPFSRGRSNQATAPREPRAGPTSLAGRPVRQRQPGLNWLRRESKSGRPATSEEPVFEEQSAAATRPSEQPRHAPIPDNETSQQEIQNTEIDLPLEQQDDILPSEEMTDHLEGVSVAPPEQSSEGERGPASPVSFGAPETAMPAIQGGEEEQNVEPFADRIERGFPRLESAEDRQADNRGDVLQSGAAAADLEREGAEESRVSEDPEHWEDDWRTAPPVPTSHEVLDSTEEESSAGIGIDEPAEASAGPERPVGREEMGMESPAIPRPEPETVETAPTLVEAAPAARTSRQLVAQFEASYAFGIRTYDESFTINTEDGELLGACGMGINESVDRAAANTDQVRLLDIWLYDRSAVRSVSQPLVSPGFNVSGLDEFADGDGSMTSPPLEVVPGLTFMLQSDRIVLECRIHSATFLDSEQAPMPFRSVSVSLAVYAQS